MHKLPDSQGELSRSHGLTPTNNECVHSAQIRGSRVLLTRFLDSSAKMLTKKLFHRAVKLEAVFFVAEAVSFVGFDDVRHFDAAFLQRLDHLVRLRFVYAWIVGALRDQERDLDFVTMENRRGRR